MSGDSGPQGTEKTDAMKKKIYHEWTAKKLKKTP